jgi:hypothetical protein
MRPISARSHKPMSDEVSIASSNSLTSSGIRTGALHFWTECFGARIACAGVYFDYMTYYKPVKEHPNCRQVLPDGGCSIAALNRLGVGG